jgi:hypothetical protein
MAGGTRHRSVTRDEMVVQRELLQPEAIHDRQEIADADLSREVGWYALGHPGSSAVVTDHLEPLRQALVEPPCWPGGPAPSAGACS